MGIPRAARAAVLEAPGEISIRTLAVPEIGSDEALLKVGLIGVCGTDVGYFTGHLAVPLPTILGHEIFGTLEAIGARAADRYQLAPGQRVLVDASIPCWTCSPCRSGEYRFCSRKREYGSKVPISVFPGLWGGMADFMYVAPGSILRAVPDALSAEGAIAAALAANAFEWLVGEGGALIGDQIVIQGAGPQGLAAAAVASAMGARNVIVTGLARDAARLQFALAVGGRHALVVDGDDIVERVRLLTGGEGADVVLDVTGSASALSTSIEMVRPKGRVVLAGLAGREARVSITPDHLVWNHIRIQGVYVKGDTAWTKALQFMVDQGSAYPLDRIVSHVFPLEQSGAAIMAGRDSNLDGFVKAAIRP